MFPWYAEWTDVVLLPQLQDFVFIKKEVEVFFQRRNRRHSSPLIHMLSGDEIFYLDLKFISHPPRRVSSPPLCQNPMWIPLIHFKPNIHFTLVVVIAGHETWRCAVMCFHLVSGLTLLTGYQSTVAALPDCLWGCWLCLSGPCYFRLRAIQMRITMPFWLICIVMEPILFYGIRQPFPAEKSNKKEINKTACSC